jgi:hypothetical protein
MVVHHFHIGAFGVLLVALMAWVQNPKNAFWRLCWQQAGDIYGESTLRIGNRLVLPV